MFCTGCGYEITDDSQFCPRCGKRLMVEQEKKDENDIGNVTKNYSQPDEPVMIQKKHEAEPQDEKEIRKKEWIAAGIISGIVAVAVVIGMIVFWFTYLKDEVQRIDEQKASEQIIQEKQILTSEEHGEELTSEKEESKEAQKNLNGGEIESKTETMISEEVVLYQNEDSENDMQEKYETGGGDFLLPDSDCQYITKEDLKEFDAEQCRLARNEIYARHGRKFQDEAVQKYFEGCSWYEGLIEPDQFEESLLNEYEVSNRDLIVEYEKEKGYR